MFGSKQNCFFLPNTRGQIPHISWYLVSCFSRFWNPIPNYFIYCSKSLQLNYYLRFSSFVSNSKLFCNLIVVPLFQHHYSFISLLHQIIMNSLQFTCMVLLSIVFCTVIRNWTTNHLRCNVLTSRHHGLVISLDFQS